jgi:hypothetical protein
MAQRAPVQPGFVLARTSDHFASLAAALAAAEDREVIEVHGNGPFLTAPQTVTGKRLTIRAAAGSQPLILFERPTARADGPFLHTDTDLRLEGLEIQWAIEGQPGFSEADRLARSAIAISHGRLVLAYCRIVSQRFNGCAAASGREVYIRNCHFVATDGMALFWRPAASGRLELESSAIEGRLALSLLLDGVAMDNTPGQLRLSHCTLVAELGAQVFVESLPRQPLPIAADHNLVDADYLFLLAGQRLARRTPRSNPEEISPVLRAALAWSEEANFYRRGMQFVARPVAGRPGAVAPADLVGVAAWLEFWKQPGAKSIEGDLVLAKATEISTLSPPVLASVSNVSGEQPADIGAPADQIGPGPAYHAWRASAADVAWPP